MPQNVIITGSTQGIGLGLATEFLRAGNNVVISGRNPEKTHTVQKQLQADFPAAQILGIPCDVNHYSQVEELWQQAKQHFGDIHIWINNAGRNNQKLSIDQLPLAEIDDTLHTNLNGMIYGSRVAFIGMQQQGFGWIWNMEGFGSEGMINIHQVPYGLSKYGLRYFTKSLVKLAKGSPVKVGYLQPGIVTTQMAVPPEQQRDDFFYRNKKILNILADHVETVCPWLVQQMLKAEKNGTAVRWLSRSKAMARFLCAPFAKRRTIDEALQRQT